MPKREYGSGSVSKRKDGSWTARVFLGKNADGKQKIKAFYGKTESEVKKKMKLFQNNIEKESKRAALKNISVETYFNDWLYEYKFNTLKLASFDRLESTVISHIVPNIGMMQIKTVTQDDIQKLLNDLKNKNKLGFSSVNKVYKALNACFKHAIIKDDILKNPVDGVVQPFKVEEIKQSNKIKYFTQDQLDILIPNIHSKYKNGKYKYRNRWAYILMLNTGLRTGEALALIWEDVDFDKKTISVNKSVGWEKIRGDDIRRTKGVRLSSNNSTKTYSSKRTIPLNKMAFTAIEELYKINHNFTHVISTAKNTIVSPRNLSETFDSIVEKSGLSQSGLHTLRHTFASLLFKNGVEIKTVSTLLGHASTKITYDTYVHLIGEEVTDAVNKLDDLW